MHRMDVEAGRTEWKVLKCWKLENRTLYLPRYWALQEKIPLLVYCMECPTAHLSYEYYTEFYALMQISSFNVSCT